MQTLKSIRPGALFVLSEPETRNLRETTIYMRMDFTGGSTSRVIHALPGANLPGNFRGPCLFHPDGFHPRTSIYRVRLHQLRDILSVSELMELSLATGEGWREPVAFDALDVIHEIYSRLPRGWTGWTLAR